MRTKSLLLATVAGVAMTPGAQAADLAIKAAPMAAPAASWAGFYFGGSLGAVQQTVYTSGNVSGLIALPSDGYTSVTSPWNPTSSRTGLIGGVQAGYNWQNGNAVYGVEADFSWLGGTASNSTFSDQYGSTFTTSGKIDWLSTYRARLGLAVGNSMAYVTGGLALGKVNNKYTGNYGTVLGGPNDNFFTTKDRSTRLGWTIGGGIEHMWSPHWTIRLQGLYVDLGSKSAVSAQDGGSSPIVKKTGFHNTAVIGTLGMNYKF